MSGFMAATGVVVCLGVLVLVRQRRLRRQMEAMTIAAAAMVREAQTQAQDLEQLVSFGQSLARSLDVEAIRGVLEGSLPRLAGTRGVWVLVRADGQWEAMMDGGAPAGETPRPDGNAAPEQLAARTLTYESDRRAEVGGLDLDGHVCFPMMAAGTAVGVLGVPAATPLPEGQRRILAAAAALLAVSMKNAQLFRELRDNSLRDGLTGLVNRTYAIEILDTELRRVRRSQMPLAVIMFDLDHFKDINDRYGHLCGDAVLATVGRRTRHVLRGGDVKCRYGGEEFLIVLPDTRPESAMRVAETLRRDIAETPIPWNVETVMVTASFGVAAARPEELDTTALIARADAALYRAKEAGRNRVCLATEAESVAEPRSA